VLIKFVSLCVEYTREDPLRQIKYDFKIDGAACSGGGRCATTSIFEQLIANAICTLVEINGAFYINLECKEFYTTLLSFSPCASTEMSHIY
jgi:hypothetical protein